MAPNSKILRVIISVFDWYPKSYPKEERRLLMKLDRAILVFGCLSFFCRFLGQQNITNAYVSGMEEDLNATGNELNYYNVAYNTAYVLGQIPLMTLQTKPKIAPFLLPTLQIFWAIIAFAQSTVTQNWHLYLLRAITGFLEASSFGGTHLILGSWYKNDELFKRAGVWFMGNSLGSMFSGYLQSAIRSGLGGVAGRSAWQWLFIVQGIITLPICILGYLFWPGLPSSPKRWYFTDEDHALAVKRIYHVEHEGITWKTFKYTLSRPMWWIAVPCYIMLVQAHYWTGYMALYLKAAGYSGNLRVILPTFIDLIRALSSWLGTTLAGVLSVRSLFTFQATLVIFAIICLTVWYIPDPLKFTAFYLGGFSGMASPILYSFVNTQLKESYGERGLVISSMMTLGFCSQIWVPLFTFPTVQAPRFPNGYPACIAFEFAMWAILMFGIWYMKGYHLRHPVPETGSDVAIVRPSSLASTSLDGNGDGDAKSEKDVKAVSPGQTTPSDSVYRLDAEKLDTPGGLAAAVGVETERKNVDVGFAAGVGDGVPVAYDVALGEEAKKQAAGERR